MAVAGESEPAMMSRLLSAQSSRLLGLELVRHVAVDFTLNTVDIYFRVPGMLTEGQASELVGVANYGRLSPFELAEMQSYLSPEGFTFAVTMDVATGVIERVAFYALGLPPNAAPEIDDRLSIFFEKAPSYDAESFTALAWSFGPGMKKYLKAEKSYCGGVLPLVRSWKSTLSFGGEMEA